MTVVQFVHPFFCWWTFKLFLRCFLAAVNTTAMNTFIRVSWDTWAKVSLIIALGCTAFEYPTLQHTATLFPSGPTSLLSFQQHL